MFENLEVRMKIAQDATAPGSHRMHLYSTESSAAQKGQRWIHLKRETRLSPQSATPIQQQPIHPLYAGRRNLVLYKERGRLSVDVHPSIREIKGDQRHD